MAVERRRTVSQPVAQIKRRSGPNEAVLDFEAKAADNRVDVRLHSLDVMHCVVLGDRLLDRRMSFGVPFAEEVVNDLEPILGRGKFVENTLACMLAGVF